MPCPYSIRFLKGTRFGKAVPPSSSQTQAAKGDKKGTQKQSRIEINHRFFIPDDPHLKRLRLLTERIQEEKMLSELKSDAIKARLTKRIKSKSICRKEIRISPDMMWKRTFEVTSA